MRTDEPDTAQSDYLAFCKESRSLSHNTLLAYEQDLTCFARYYRSKPDQTVFNLNVVLSYLWYLRERKNLQPATVRRRILTLRAFAAWLLKTDRIELSPFAGHDLDLKLPRRLPRPVDRSVVLGMLTEPQDSVTSLAIKLMIATGIRVGELTNIRISDIHDEGWKIRIRGKGNRERTVYIGNSALLEELRACLVSRKAVTSSAEFLLLNTRGARLTEQALRGRLRNLSSKLGIQPHITPHRFRHSAATYLIEEGVDIRFVQRLLGHSSIATTEIYTRVSDTSLMTAIEIADPLGKL
jgi:integrase/recombinase XerD